MDKPHHHYLLTNRSLHHSTRDSTVKVIQISVHRPSHSISTVLSPRPTLIIPKGRQCSNHPSKRVNSRAMETMQINKASNKLPRRNYRHTNNSHPLNKTMVVHHRIRVNTNSTSSQFRPNRQPVPCRLVCPVVPQ